MAKHIRALRLSDADHYLHWCRQNGLEASLEKSARDRSEELEIPRRLQAALEAQARIQQNPRKFLKQCCADEIDPNTITRPGWREVAAAIASSRSGDRQRLADFLLHIESVSDLMFASTTFRRQTHLFAWALVRLHDRQRQWIRNYSDWRPDKHNVRRQFGSLLRHLLTKYDVPTFMDMAWLREEKGAYRYRDWFIHLGLGRNIRTARTHYPMTRMIAHHFTAAPADYSIEGALMLADIRSLGGGQRLAEALMATRLGLRVEHDKDKRAFWISVYRFFIENPMLDLRHAGPIIDFLAYQKFEPTEVMVRPGRMELRPPPQPNLTMTRRTAATLLRQVEEWHGQLRKQKAADGRFWKRSGFEAFATETGPRDRPERQVRWWIRELLSGQELVDEGRDLGHCVATYADSCARGLCSIWTMERAAHDEPPEKLLTIEVDQAGRLIEARGLHNRWPQPDERSILEAWMKKAGLRPGPYLYGW
jgi:hypothetical protein